MKPFASLVVPVLALTVAFPGAVLAQTHGGGSPHGGGAPHPAAVPHPAPAVIRSVLPVRTAPVVHPAPAAGGFNLNHDIAPVRERTVAPLPLPPPRTVSVPRSPSVGSRPGTTTRLRHAPAVATVSGGQFRNRFHGTAVRNPRAPQGRYGWNRGVAWQPAPTFWGGGFWGPFAVADFAGAVLFGSIVDDRDGYVYDSYQVEPDTPGADLLGDYGLQQTQCGSPNLVDIWGPNGSVICALPNDQVGPGEYEVDPTTLELIPATP